ncbi:LLM class flavin-dependent oxidoreductase [Ktedonospora formicarum]|uniref:Luciferase-like protein n=1 Tax=Ktedonospora formicarum TaxID=2778364 RepID=A0A8J3MWW8_9CHLR|nr:LLM class flavin-dependent oxidoreductase [Ktedonospora formicarum]GHO49406.1 luciferase-like protein [Ktedonospora formicarum]
MQYGFVIPIGDIHTIAELAQLGEEAGWDGMFYWDGIYIESMPEMYDPWVVMAAMAMRTQRVRLGAIITPLSRRRPWKVAREATTLDHLSHGRLILPVGLGALDDGGFGKVGEATDRKERAELLDESLDIITGLWSERSFTYKGKHYQVDGLTYRPTPVQQPRIPIWVVGAWKREKSMARALRYDGLLPNNMNGPMTPEEMRVMRDYIAERRTSPFDIIWEGETPGNDMERASSIVRPWAEAGATWWLESRWSTQNIDEVRARIQQGPPRIS